MAREVLGISLDRLEDPIAVALREYQRISNGVLAFDIKNASRLEPTPTLVNSARSATDTLYQGVTVGKLYVIAFKPGDGTGSEVSHKLEDLEVDSVYPRRILVVPRGKKGVHSEGHLTVIRHEIDNIHAEPELYAGTFDLLGLDGNRVRKIGELGHPETQTTYTPVTTLTVGYKNEIRTGDPHAVFNRINGWIQVCAFLAISDEIQKQYSGILNTLNPQFSRT